MKVIAGIDLGATRIKLVGVSESGDVRDQSLVETNDGSLAVAEKVEHWIAVIREHIEKLEQRISTRVDSVGIAAPGLVAADGKAIENMPGRLEGLVGLDWTATLGLRRPIAVVNDAHAALLAEAWVGAASGFRDVVLLTLGTGVGGAAMVEGSLLRGAIGRGAHFGHMTLDLDGPSDICGAPGSLEWFLGDVTVAERSAGRYRTNGELVAAYRKGDPDASRLWLRSMRALACGISSIINLFDPELVVLAGGLTEAWEAIEGPLERYMDEVEWRPRGARVEIRRAALGSFAGAIGAARNAALTNERRSNA